MVRFKKCGASGGKIPRPRDGIVSHKTTRKIIWSRKSMFPVTCKIKSFGRAWSGFIWLRRGTGGGLL